MNENQNEYVDINAHDNYPDSEQKIEIPTMKVIPLKKICMTIGALPTSYLNTLSYYEMLVWFIEYLKNNIIPTINNNASAVQEVQAVVLNLQNYINNYKDSIDSSVEELEEYMNNYFENLDVQEEINNKLDQMLEDGVLEQIIEQFIQSTAIWCFDTVADMQAATNLINGSYAKTLGYYSVNDGGGATYKITDTESQTEYQEELGDLYATLIIYNDTVDVRQVGAKGDGITDDSDAINTALSLGVPNVMFGQNKTYMVRGYEAGQAEGSTEGLLATTGLIVKSNSVIDLNGSNIKIIPNSRHNYHAFTIKNISNVTLKNGNIIGDVDGHEGNTGEWGYGIALLHAKNINLLNLNISKCWGDGINLNNSTGTAGSDNENIFIENCICDDNRRQGMSIESIDGLYVNNSSFINTGYTKYTGPSCGVDIEPFIDYNKCENINFNNCIFKNNRRSGLLSTNSTITKYININNCKFINNMVAEGNPNDQGNLSITRGQFINIENCEIGNTNKITNCYLRTNYSGSSNLHNYFNFKNNTVYNTCLLLRPINCDYVDFNIENNIFSNDLDINTYLIFFETNTGYTENNKHVIGNFINNEFKINKNNLLLSYIYCGNFTNSGINKLNIKNNNFCYGNKHLNIGVPFIAENNIFTLSKNVGINILTGNADNSIFIIKNNIFEYPNYGDTSLGLIEDWPTNYLIYAIRNIVYQDKLLNNNDLPSNPETHTNSLSMFVYNREGSTNESNNIY